MKITIFSDIQFNNWQEFSKILPNGRNSRFQDQLSVLDEIFNYTVESGSDILIHNGDLFETLKDEINKALYLTVFDKFVEFSKNKKIVILLVGNHDQMGRFGENNVLKPFKEIDNVLVMDTSTVENLGDVDLAFIPYTIGNFNSEVYHILDQLSGKQSYLFTHQGISGAKVGPRDEPLKSEYGLKDFFQTHWLYIFNGHYHKRQIIGDKLQIIGSPLQRDFGERNDEKGFLTLDTDTNRLDYITIQAAPWFFKVEGKKFQVPKGFRDDIDFLWYVGDEEPGSVPATIQNLRVDVVKEDGYKTRSEINISFPIEEQMRKWIEFVKTELDVSKLLEIGVRCWKKSL